MISINCYSIAMFTSFDHFRRFDIAALFIYIFIIAFIEPQISSVDLQNSIARLTTTES